MHVYFSGVGGVGIGPLALIAKEAGYEVSGSDLKDGPALEYLRRQGIKNIHVGQTRIKIAQVHKKRPIDWFVYSSALPKSHPELLFCQEKGIKTSKRDELLNEILEVKNQKMIAIAGTHGKTTTTAMVVWLFKQLGLPVSYSLGAQIGFGEMGHFNPASHYFVYECDEFDRNFLAFKPYLSIITGLGWDHHEIFPTQSDYNQAFEQFLNQSQQIVIWKEDIKRLNPSSVSSRLMIEDEENPQIAKISLAGLYNRRDAWLAVQAVHAVTDKPVEKLIENINRFPGVGRRFEKIVDNLYSDDAHTPEKIVGAMNVAKEMTGNGRQKIVVIYEPLTNRRMHYTAKNHRDVFDGASAIYWLPSYLAREDPKQRVLKPSELIKNLRPRLQKIAQPAERNTKLKSAIKSHLEAGDLVIAMAGGGTGSLDEWLRKQFNA